MLIIKIHYNYVYVYKYIVDIYLLCMTRKWFPLQGKLAPLTKNVVLSLIRSMLAAGIVQETFAGEAG